MDSYIYTVIQQIIVGTIFLAAVAFISRLLYNSFQAKNACSSGCGKCGAIDFKKIEEKMRQKSMSMLEK
ncbi:MAG: FeoB-associated Cys-rich membrane protein [Bacteroidia bacterium]|nr:FeoB-associated Cys-rich membrane protein [Bacteroidia bacterium]